MSKFKVGDIVKINPKRPGRNELGLWRIHRETVGSDFVSENDTFKIVNISHGYIDIEFKNQRYNGFNRESLILALKRKSHLPEWW